MMISLNSFANYKIDQEKNQAKIIQINGTRSLRAVRADRRSGYA